MSVKCKERSLQTKVELKQAGKGLLTDTLSALEANRTIDSKETNTLAKPGIANTCAAIVCNYQVHLSMIISAFMCNPQYQFCDEGQLT